MNFRITLIAAILSVTALSTYSKTTTPNIIIVITDDQGKNDLACEGNPYVKTPNIDKFYDNAVRFTNYHVSTTCAPSRGALMTGRHTNRLNVHHTINGRSILFEDETLLPEILKNNGYTCGHFGKWHLGDNYPFRPMDRGFDQVVRHGGGGITQGPDYWGNDYFDDTYWKNGVPTKYEGYCTDVFFSEALKFIEDNKDQPFFCYISTNAPHGPLNCPEKYMDLYKDNPEIKDTHQRFYGMITNIDDNFKILQDKLKQLKINDNTIVIFTTDNGTAFGSKMYDAGMTGHKGQVTEGGHRVPFYLQWPAKGLTGGKDINNLVAHIDILPTLIDIIGLKHNEIKPIDGKSWKPLLYPGGSTWDNRILYVDTQRMINLTKYKDYAVMDDNWRLVNGNKLYDMRNDLKQEKNVIAQYPKEAARLAQGYETWWTSIEQENINDRYAYIKVGAPQENPSCLMSHDLLTGKLENAWHQYGAIEAVQATGIWKVHFVADGKYKISLRRFPRESSLKINATFPEGQKERRLQEVTPASTKSDFAEAFLYVAKHKKTQEIKGDAEEVTFELDMAAGKYDLQAELIDKVGRVHPAYYLYIEKI